MRLTSYHCGFAKWGVVSETTAYNSDRNLHQMIVNHITSQHSPFPWHSESRSNNMWVWLAV